MCLQGDEEETQQKPVWLQEDGEEVGSPTAANAGQLHLEGPTPTQPMDPQGAADFIGLDDDTPGLIHNQSTAVTQLLLSEFHTIPLYLTHATIQRAANTSVLCSPVFFVHAVRCCLFSHPFIAAYLSTSNVAAMAVLMHCPKGHIAPPDSP